MKKLIFALLFALTILSTFSSAYVIRNAITERNEEWQRWIAYKDDYAHFYGLDDYKEHLYEPNLARNFGFYPESRYQIPYDVYQAKYNPPLQGEVYSTNTRYVVSSLNQPNAVKYYADDVNGRYSGYVRPDLNGVYFDHPQARQTYGYISSGGYGYGGQGYGYQFSGNQYYARVADSVGDGYYTVGYY